MKQKLPPPKLRSIHQIDEFTDHALVNICCSGNKAWSEAAMKELNKRKK